MKQTRRYHHFDFTERELIERHIIAGITCQVIAMMLGRHQRSVEREIERHSVANHYDATVASESARLKRLQAKTETWKLKPEMFDLISRLMREKRLSPEQIYLWCQKQKIAMVCKTWIYQLIRKDRANGGDLYKFLPCQGCKRKWRGTKRAGRGYLKNIRPIADRPAIVDQKVRLGDGEIDTIEGKGKKSCLVTYVDRVTKMVKIMRVEGLSSLLVTQAIKTKLTSYAPYILTITSDNGKEFARHEEIANRLGCDFYFCDPFSSWQRGLNEQTNRLVRAFFPKKTDFLQVTDQEVQHVEDLLNDRLRKTLDWQTPNEVFATLCAA